MATIRRQMKNMVKNYSEAEVKVREATSNDPWGPSSTLMSEISDLTYNIVALGEIMRMLWKRLNDHGKNWRHVYKSLVLLDYLVKNGNEKVAQQCKEHIVAIQTLKDFQFMDEQKDQGASVREKAKQLVNLLRDDERLKIERSKAFTAREKFARNAMGISSDNKIIYATINPNGGGGGRQALGVSSRTNGGNYADPYGGAAGGGGGGGKPLAADIEAVRPSDPNEEDLQIKLAIMLSQQEQEEEEKRKRNDDAKLQIALEQSKFEGQPNGLLDLDFSPAFGNNINTNDPWGTNGNSQKGKLNSNNEDTDSDDFFPPLPSMKNANGLNGKNLIPDDPWATPSIAVNTKSANLNDPWKNTNNKTNISNQTYPWLPNSATNNTVTSNDPWNNTNTNVNNNNKPDDFDYFTSNRVKTPSSPVAAQSQATITATALDPFGDLFANSNEKSHPIESTNPWTTTNENSSSNMSTSTTTAASNAAKNNSNGIRKTPESFLGENSSLVNLENLIPSRPKSTNPFGVTPMTSGLSSSTSSGQLNNPFAAQQALQSVGKPSINQLQQQQQQQQHQQSLYPSLFNNNNNNNSLFMNNNSSGQLAQPLIVPPRVGMDIANGGILMPMLNSQAMNNNINNINATNSSMFLSSNVANSTNPFLAM